MIQSKEDLIRRRDSSSDEQLVDCFSCRCGHDRHRVRTMDLHLLSEIQLSVCICEKYVYDFFFSMEGGEKMPEAQANCVLHYLPIVIVVVARFDCIRRITFVLELEKCEWWTEWSGNQGLKSRFNQLIGR